MTEHFADRLSCLIEERGPICAGLDPRENQLPHHGTRRMSDIAWGQNVILALRDLVPIFKPQIAFWRDSWERLADLNSLDGATGDAMVLVDCKRGDIGATAKAYAEHAFGYSWVDAITVNPYLGEDSLQPFVDAAEEQNRGIFVLVQTSNPGAGDLQTVDSMGWTIAERVAVKIVHALGARLPKSQSGRTRVGAVIGLTVSPYEIKALRKHMPDAFFLMPGYGAQGGDPACLEAALDERGGGVLVSASRSLTLPWGKEAAPDNWRDMILQAHADMIQDLQGRSG